MGARQIIQGIEELPPQEFDEVVAYLREREGRNVHDADGIKYITREEARPLMEKIFTDHAELFRKLAE